MWGKLPNISDFEEMIITNYNYQKWMQCRVIIRLCVNRRQTEMEIEEGYKGPSGRLIISCDTPILMQCRIISVFPADRQMWSEDDRSDQQRVPQASL